MSQQVWCRNRQISRPPGAPADLASTGRERGKYGERRERENDEYENPVAPKDMIESPEDRATWNAVQKTIREEDP